MYVLETAEAVGAHRYMDGQQNTSNNIEFSIMAEVTCQHLHDLSDNDKFKLDVGLRAPIAECATRVRKVLQQQLGLGPNVPADQFKTSRTARVNEFECVSFRDVVVCKGTSRLLVGEVWFFAECLGEPCALISFWDVRGADLAKGSVDALVHERNVVLFPLEDILCVHAPPHVQ